MKKVTFKDWKASDTEKAVKEMKKISKKLRTTYLIIGFAGSFVVAIVGSLTGLMPLTVLAALVYVVCLALAAVANEGVMIATKGEMPNFAMSRVVLRLLGGLFPVLFLEKAIFILKLDIKVAGWTNYKEYLR